MKETFQIKNKETVQLTTIYKHLVNRENNINKSHVRMWITNFPEYSRTDITILPIKVEGGE